VAGWIHSNRSNRQCSIAGFVAILIIEMAGNLGAKRGLRHIMPEDMPPLTTPDRPLAHGYGASCYCWRVLVFCLRYAKPACTKAVQPDPSTASKLWMSDATCNDRSPTAMLIWLAVLLSSLLLLPGSSLCCRSSNVGQRTT
jgi:hypothetical protein